MTTNLTEFSENRKKIEKLIKICCFAYHVNHFFKTQFLTLVPWWWFAVLSLFCVITFFFLRFITNHFHLSFFPSLRTTNNPPLGRRNRFLQHPNKTLPNSNRSNFQVWRIPVPHYDRLFSVETSGKVDFIENHEKHCTVSDFRKKPSSRISGFFFQKNNKNRQKTLCERFIIYFQVSFRVGRHFWFSLGLFRWLERLEGTSRWRSGF